VQFQADVTLKLPKRVEGELYRIAIEALNNALKHAQAGLVSVYLDCRDRQVELVVADNGRGFNLDEMNECSVGLRMMRERAEKLGGQLVITSAPGQGTQVVVSVEIIE
jgi:NarL family two-component system sensor histidine kinase LiaS